VTLVSWGSETDDKLIGELRAKAEEGDAHSQNRLAGYYGQGYLVAKDQAEAVKWYRKAAEQNLPQAQLGLAACYDNGWGVKMDHAQAAKLDRKAAEQNYSPAQAKLGGRYARGEAVAKDYVEAYKWSLLAAGQGDWMAKNEIQGLEKVMSRAEIAEGQKLARNFNHELEYTGFYSYDGYGNMVAWNPKSRERPPTGSDSSDTGIAATRPESSGTGFFITEDGYLVTNQHVAGKGAQVRLVTASGLIAAKVVHVDTANDLALLKAEGKFASLPVAASRAVMLGRTVATVGFPNIGLQGFAPKLAKGEIASLSGAQDDPRYFQISVPVQPGNSGGALVDEHGNVVGVVAAKLSAKAALSTSGELPENVNYAVKSSLLLSFLESAPQASAKLKGPNTKEQNFEDIVKSIEQATVLVLVY
jgi:S1-C subfamily serine protease